MHRAYRKPPLYPRIVGACRYKTLCFGRCAVISRIIPFLSPSSRPSSEPSPPLMKRLCCPLSVDGGPVPRALALLTAAPRNALFCVDGGWEQGAAHVRAIRRCCVELNPPDPQIERARLLGRDASGARNGRVQVACTRGVGGPTVRPEPPRSFGRAAALSAGRRRSGSPLQNAHANRG